MGWRRAVPPHRPVVGDAALGSVGHDVTHSVNSGVLAGAAVGRVPVEGGKADRPDTAQFALKRPHRFLQGRSGQGRGFRPWWTARRRRRETGIGAASGIGAGKPTGAGPAVGPQMECTPTKTAPSSTTETAPAAQVHDRLLQKRGRLVLLRAHFYFVPRFPPPRGERRQILDGSSTRFSSSTVFVLPPCPLRASRILIVPARLFRCASRGGFSASSQ